MIRSPTPEPACARAAEPARWGPRLFTWGIWAGLLLGQLAGLATYAVNVPHWDDWFNVPFMTGQQPITLGWLWDQTPGAETRTPVIRWLFVTLFRLGGQDLRAHQLFNVLVLAALALALVRVSVRLRGRPAYTDAFFPCLLLHWGHSETVLWSTMIFIAVPLALVGSLLLLVARTPHRLTMTRAVPAGVALVLLPLTGTSGLVFVPFVGLWLAWAGLRAWRSPDTGTRPAAATALVCVAIAGLLTVLFFLGDHERGGGADQSRAEQLDGTLKVLAVILGPSAWVFWPYVAWVVPSVLGVAAVWLAWIGYQSPESRLRAWGLLLILTAGVGLAALLGWKRPSSWCFTLYYGTMPLLGLCAAYLACCRFGPAEIRTFAQTCMFGLMAATLALNVREGLQISERRRDGLANLEQAIRAGVPPSVLTRGHAPIVFWNPVDDRVHVFHQQLYDLLLALRAANVGVFGQMVDDYATMPVPLLLEPAAMHDLTWDAGTATGAGEGSSITFALPEARFVNGIRIRYQHSASRRGPSYYRFSPGLAPYFQVEWTVVRENQPDEVDRYLDVENTVGPDRQQEITIWVFENVRAIHIRPDRRPFTCHIAEITLLVPPAEPASP